MPNYKLKQLYPGLPKSWEVGEELFFQAPIVGFAYYVDKFDTHRLRKEDVEENPEFFEKLIDFEQKGIVFGDTILAGVEVTDSGGNRKFVKATPPIILKTAEENNKR